MPNYLNYLKVSKSRVFSLGLILVGNGRRGRSHASTCAATPETLGDILKAELFVHVFFRLCS
jgi:hypothetical protein